MALGLVSNRVYDWPIRLKTSRLDRLRVSCRQLSESDHLLVKPTKRLVVRVDRWPVDACEKSTPAKTGEATSRKVSLWVHTPPSLSWLTPGGQPILTPGVTTWVVCIGLESRRDQPTDRSTANRLSAPISVQSPNAHCRNDESPQNQQKPGTKAGRQDPGLGVLTHLYPWLFVPCGFERLRSWWHHFRQSPR